MLKDISRIIASTLSVIFAVISICYAFNEGYAQAAYFMAFAVWMGMNNDRNN